ncbi:MAG: hypothetical protein ACI9EF_002259 [Pseudohongiellaceae bacterium]
MPVWHELAQRLRENHDFVVVGIAQEQHPERCALYATWQRFDWPILWDPFNLTEAAAVPNVYALDEAGIVRAIRPTPSTFAADFLERTFPAAPSEASSAAPTTAPVEAPAVDAGAPARVAAVVPQLVECDRTAAGTAEGDMWRSLSRLLFADPAKRPWDEAVAVLGSYADDHPDDARAAFRRGVALRMRYDSPQRQSADFQGALDAWSEALAMRPNEYIWRRRIQQYGPALDKPYPFYPWVDAALQALQERGEPAPALTAALTMAERAQPRRSFETAADQSEPDPTGAIVRDDGSWLEVDTAVAYHTSASKTVARVHVALRPVTTSAVHWNNEAEPLLVWFGDDALPDDWELGSRLQRIAGDTSQVVSSEVRSAEVELRLPAGATGTLSGYALYYACDGVDGLCTYLRRDFAVTVSAL